MEEKEEKNRKTPEQMAFQNHVPNEILKELTPEVRRQYFLWDEIIKREVELYPWLIKPLISEIFQKSYPDDAVIRLLSTEYVVSGIYEKGERLLRSIHSDILIQIGKDIYHLECQMKPDSNMVLRMMEYDMNIALIHGKKQKLHRKSDDIKIDLLLPKSVILYLDHAGSMPDEEKCRVRLADGTSYIYKVPVMKVQDYSLQMIEDRHLNILIPFLPIRFRKHLKPEKEGTKDKISDSVRKELTGFIRECIIIVNREKENGMLTEKAGTDLVEFLGKACDHLFINKPDILAEVHEIMEPAIKLMREELEDKLKESEDKLKGTENKLRGTQNKLKESEERLKKSDRQLESSIKNLIANCGAEGKSMTQTRDLIRQIFTLDEQTAEERIKQYWNS